MVRGDSPRRRQSVVAFGPVALPRLRCVPVLAATTAACPRCGWPLSSLTRDDGTVELVCHACALRMVPEDEEEGEE